MNAYTHCVCNYVVAVIYFPAFMATPQFVLKSK